MHFLTPSTLVFTVEIGLCRLAVDAAQFTGAAQDPANILCRAAYITQHHHQTIPEGRDLAYGSSFFPTSTAAVAAYGNVYAWEAMNMRRRRQSSWETL